MYAASPNTPASVAAEQLHVTFDKVRERLAVLGIHAPDAPKLEETFGSASVGDDARGSTAASNTTTAGAREDPPPSEDKTEEKAYKEGVSRATAKVVDSAASMARDTTVEYLAVGKWAYDTYADLARAKGYATPGDFLSEAVTFFVENKERLRHTQILVAQLQARNEELEAYVGGNMELKREALDLVVKLSVLGRMAGTPFPRDDLLTLLEAYRVMAAPAAEVEAGGREGVG